MNIERAKNPFWLCHFAFPPAESLSAHKALQENSIFGAFEVFCSAPYAVCECKVDTWMELNKIEDN